VPSPKKPPAQDRRKLIADAALRLLAEQGARGVTHRAVDSELALAAGSTSYYFRTRAALLLAAAEHLVALDTADIQELAADAGGPADIVERWLSPERRMRSLARIELLLVSAREPDFEFMRETRAAFIAGAERTLKGDRKQRHADAQALVALVDGFILHGLVSGPVSPSEARHAFERFQRADELGDKTAATVSPRGAETVRRERRSPRRPRP
jgi:DNA-binding transcriptional regulator YbjK